MEWWPGKELETHSSTLGLPRLEIYEEGHQNRSSSKSTKATIVEGLGRKRYRQDWEKILIYALSSNDETLDPLENLFETKSLADDKTFHRRKARLKL